MFESCFKLTPNREKWKQKLWIKSRIHNICMRLVFLSYNVELWFANNAGRAAALAAPDEKITRETIVKRKPSEYVVSQVKAYACSLRKDLLLPLARFINMNTARENRGVKNINLVYFKATQGRVSAWWNHMHLLCLE